MKKFPEIVVDFIFNVINGTKRVRVFFTTLAGTFFTFLVFFTIYAALMLDRFCNFSRLFTYPWSLVIGLPVICSGIFVWLWSAWQFLKAKGTPVPFCPPSSLICTGPYAYVRNPMLDGVFLILFGIGFLAGSISLVFIFTPLFVFCSVLEFRFIEEPELEKRLGREYVEYKKRTPMLLPRFC